MGREPPIAPHNLKVRNAFKAVIGQGYFDELELVRFPGLREGPLFKRNRTINSCTAIPVTGQNQTISERKKTRQGKPWRGSI